MNFALSAILTATTGKMMSEDWRECLALADHMTGESVATPQGGRIFEADSAPAILAQHPGLADVDAGFVTPDNWHQFMAEQVQRFGLLLWLDPLARYDHRDPTEEAEAMLGDKANEKLLLYVPQWPTRKEAGP